MVAMVQPEAGKTLVFAFVQPLYGVPMCKQIICSLWHSLTRSTFRRQYVHISACSKPALKPWLTNPGKGASTDHS